MTEFSFFGWSVFLNLRDGIRKMLWFVCVFSMTVGCSPVCWTEHEEDKLHFILFTARSLLFRGKSIFWWQSLWAASCFFYRICPTNILCLDLLLDLLSVTCAQGPVSQSAMMNYDRPVTECHLGEIDSFTVRAGQHLLAASLTPAVAENDFSHGLLHFLHSE